MIKLIIKKELYSILTSTKFVSTFITCSALILLSIYIGIKEYQFSLEQYNTGSQLADQELREKTSWIGMSTHSFRQPDPIQIFTAGVHNDIGRFSEVSNWTQVKVQNSNYSDDPVFAIFRSIDFTLIVQLILSLMAILLTYDAVNGEREKGTLKLIFSNPASKAKFIIAKFIGSWLALIIPLAVPVLTGILLILLFNIQFTLVHWVNTLLLILISVFYLSFFIFLGILLSAVIRNSATSFIALLAFWIIFVLIIPRIGVLIAGQFVSVPSTAQIEGQRNKYESQLWEKHKNELMETWSKRNLEMAGMSSEERRAYEDEHLWKWMEEDDEARRGVQAEISEYHRKQNEYLRNSKLELEKLAFNLSRFSPASSYYLAALNIASTDITLKTRFENALEEYRNSFVKFTEQKQKENPGMGGIQITMNSESGFSFKTPDYKKTIDVSELPKFIEPKQQVSDVLQATIIDMGLLSCYIILTFIIAFYRFIRYDVR